MLGLLQLFGISGDAMPVPGRQALTITCDQSGAATAQVMEPLPVALEPRRLGRRRLEVTHPGVNVRPRAYIGYM